MRLSQVTGSSRRENGSWLLLSETLHWAADPVDWLSNAVSRRVGPQLQPKQAGGQGVGRAGRRATGPAKTLAVAVELRWGPRPSWCKQCNEPASPQADQGRSRSMI